MHWAVCKCRMFLHQSVSQHLHLHRHLALALALALHLHLHLPLHHCYPLLLPRVIALGSFEGVAITT